MTRIRVRLGDLPPDLVPMRQQAMALHTRGSLIRWTSTRCATAFRFVAGVTTSFPGDPSAPHQHGIGQQPLLLRVLVLQRPQPRGFRDVHPAEFGFPFIDAGVADTMLD
jgi:hypothetical protein